MRSALMALAVSILAALGSMLGADPLITVISIVVSVFKVAQAADVFRRNRPANIYPYRFQWMR